MLVLLELLPIKLGFYLDPYPSPTPDPEPTPTPAADQVVMIKLCFYLVQGARTPLPEL